MKNRIICIGNRLIENDRAGVLVYDLLAAQTMPTHTELIEGGISGLNLLCFLENAGTVVFVDTVSGFTTPGGVVVLNKTQIKLHAQNFITTTMPVSPMFWRCCPMYVTLRYPGKFFWLGLETPARESAIEHAATLSLSLIQNG